MKTVGIIGGLGPETTAKFYLKLIFACFKHNKINRPPVLMWSIPIDFQTESNFITKNLMAEKYLPHLVDAAKRLEKGGADLLVIPCNSVHVFIEEIKRSVKIPVLSIVEETANFLVSKKIKKVGLLATVPTVDSKIYNLILEKKGIKIILPNKEDQVSIGKLIKKIVLNKHKNKERKLLLKIINKLRMKGAEHILLACTDLQLIVSPKLIPNVIDTMEILLKSTVQKILD